MKFLNPLIVNHNHLFASNFAARIYLLALLGLNIALAPFLGLQAQNEVSPSAWKTLEDVTFETKVENNFKVDYPVFGSKVKSLEGKQIELKGYVLPLEMGGKNTFIFSLLPYSQCFFCGGGGPETVVEVNAREEVAYSLKPLTIRGKLRLNGKDYNHLMYILDDAVAVD
ncbi:MAG: DUF3299 domain-containing protein [Bacteroidia bacterium]|nr:DUF3299 domain-containing protein [Bacteroidia bacterium]